METETIPSRAATENVPPELMKRLIGTAEKQMVSQSAIIRACLMSGLPVWDAEMERFCKKALQKKRDRAA